MFGLLLSIKESIIITTEVNNSPMAGFEEVCVVN
jgi:hypothetical protein